MLNWPLFLAEKLLDVTWDRTQGWSEVIEPSSKSFIWLFAHIVDAENKLTSSPIGSSETSSCSGSPSKSSPGIPDVDWEGFSIERKPDEASCDEFQGRLKFWDELGLAFSCCCSCCCRRSSSSWRSRCLRRFSRRWTSFSLNEFISAMWALTYTWKIKIQNWCLRSKF